MTPTSSRFAAAFLAAFVAATASLALRPTRVTGQADLVPADDPVYDVLAALARGGYVPNAAPRQFAGVSEAAYSQREILAFVLSAVRPLTTPRDVRWPWIELNANEAGWYVWLVERYREPLTACGVDVEQVRAWLDGRFPASTSLLGTALGELRVGTGDDPLDARAELTGMVAHGERLTAGATFDTDGSWAYTREYDRDDLRGWFVSYDLSRHLNLTAGRQATRIGPGLQSLLWGDRARPLDGLSMRLETQVFGRPLAIWEQVGTFADGARKYVTIQRLEYEPADGLTVAGSLGLITDRALQAAGSPFMPLYWARFLAGRRAAGGRGNLLGSVDVAWRPDRHWLLYGEFFADDFDFSPEPPRTAQRIGWLGGVQFIPPGSLPGTSYRFEACILPDTGTYTGQQEPRLAWLRDGVLLGHEYGQDSSGWRFLGRQRLGAWCDVTLSYEQFRQLRESASPARTTRFDVVARRDLGRHLQLGLGYRSRRLRNAGGVAGADSTTDTLYLEARASY